MNRLSTHEQSRSFFRGLQPSLEAHMRQRLQQKFIDHLPDDPFDIDAVYEAVRYVLMGSTSMGMVQVLPPPPPQAPNPPVAATTSTSSGDPSMIKIEAMIAAVMASFGSKISDQIKDAINQQAGARPRNAGAAALGVNGESGSRGACNFCRSTDHFIRDCDVIVEYTKASKCNLKCSSVSSKVVLPSGAKVPHGIPGAWLRDRIDEWHRQNPGQMGAVQMLFEVTVKVTVPSETLADQSYSNHPAWNVGHEPGVVSAAAYALNRQARPCPEVVVDPQPPCNCGRAGQGEHTSGASSKVAPQARQNEAPPQENQGSFAANQNQDRGKPLEPTHPYAAASDATNGSVPGPVHHAAREPAVDRHEPAFRSSVKVYDHWIVQAVFDRTMATLVTVMQRELPSLAPKVRTQVADATVKRHVPREPLVQAMIEEVDGDDSDNEDPIEETPRSVRIVQLAAANAKAACAPPADTTVITDPFYKAYLCAQAISADLDESEITIATESSSLCAILPIIDGQERVEAILDLGCQIVAMLEQVLTTLALCYDPTIHLHMVLVNGGVDQSLGLAHNVPFLVSTITLYLQVHVLHAPAYNILLGRPFDVLTQSIVRNFADENQTITILDSNTGQKATVPTIPHSTFRFAEQNLHKCKVHSSDF